MLHICTTVADLLLMTFGTTVIVFTVLICFCAMVIVVNFNYCPHVMYTCDDGTICFDVDPYQSLLSDNLAEDFL